MEKNYFKILTGSTGSTYHIPIFLEEKIDVMGIMSSFDGNIEQIEQFCNFSYSGNNNTIIIYNTTDTKNLKTLTESEYTINWGDNNISGLTMPGINTNILPSCSHSYDLSLTGVTITITINSPWKVEKVSKFISLPFKNNYGWYSSDISGLTDLGTLTYTIPYTSEVTNQEYLYDYRIVTGFTKPTNINFMGIGKSRLNEYKSYGSGNTYSIITTTGVTDIGNYTGYTIDGLFYFDYPDGYTYITGSTSGTTQFPYINEEVYNGMLTRNEFLIGFIDEPQIYSDIFIERGKQSLMERNLRLGEIDNIGELQIYGGGFFKIKKQ